MGKSVSSVTIQGKESPNMYIDPQHLVLVRVVLLEIEVFEGQSGALKHLIEDKTQIEGQQFGPKTRHHSP